MVVANPALKAVYGLRVVSLILETEVAALDIVVQVNLVPQVVSGLLVVSPVEVAVAVALAAVQVNPALKAALGLLVVSPVVVAVAVAPVAAQVNPAQPMAHGLLVVSPVAVLAVAEAAARLAGLVPSARLNGSLMLTGLVPLEKPNSAQSLNNPLKTAE